MRRIVPLLLTAAVLGLAADDSLWVSLRHRYLGLKTLSGTFTENICSEQAGTCTPFEGKFSISVPARYRLEVTDPQQQLIISDSTNLWVYLPDQKLAQKQPAGGFAPVLAFLGPVLDSTATGEVTKDSSGTYVVKVTMNDDMSAMNDLVLELNETATRINGFSFVDGWGNKVHFGLYDQQWNPTLSPKLFKFTPPKGVTVEE
ncbi:MAG: outer membrane lipoprotein chaperone LolA [candidate division WOR-3 bacterium]|nr:outer membrane lipoprotein chaperone LolA [candidate division WOR-3 bacterium]